MKGHLDVKLKSQQFRKYVREIYKCNIDWIELISILLGNDVVASHQILRLNSTPRGLPARLNLRQEIQFLSEKYERKGTTFSVLNMHCFHCLRHARKNSEWIKAPPHVSLRLEIQVPRGCCWRSRRYTWAKLNVWVIDIDRGMHMHY